MAGGEFLVEADAGQTRKENQGEPAPQGKSQDRSRYPGRTGAASQAQGQGVNQEELRTVAAAPVQRGQRGHAAALQEQNQEEVAHRKPFQVRAISP